MEEHCLWLASLSLLSLLLLRQSQDHLPRESTTLSRLGLSTLIINQENALQIYVWASLMGTFSQVKFLFPNDFALCQVDGNLARTVTH